MCIVSIAWTIQANGVFFFNHSVSKVVCNTGTADPTCFMYFFFFFHITGMGVRWQQGHGATHGIEPKLQRNNASGGCVFTDDCIAVAARLKQVWQKHVGTSIICNASFSFILMRTHEELLTFWLETCSFVKENNTTSQPNYFLLGVRN